LPDAFLIQKSRKARECFNAIAFQPCFRYAIRKIHENQVGLKLNGTHQLLAYAYDVNLLGDNIDTIKKNIETLIDISNEVGLKCMQRKLSTYCSLMTRMQSKIMI
jgi:hypothetical protein